MARTRVLCHRAYEFNSLRRCSTLLPFAHPVNEPNRKQSVYPVLFTNNERKRDVDSNIEQEQGNADKAIMIQREICLLQYKNKILDVH